jgi:hypothetical protein
MRNRTLAAFPLVVVGLLAGACSSGDSGPDCNGVVGGTAFHDQCGSCVADAAHACGPIDTIPSWDGSTHVLTFGVPNTATYGQTVTLSGAANVTGFAFEVLCSAAVTLRGHVYAWDGEGTKATGPSLFDSAAVTLESGEAFDLVSISTGNLSLSPGSYVFFVSTSEDQGGGAAGCQFGSGADVHPGGLFCYQNSGADTAKWTGSIWSCMGTDLAFRVDGLVP